MAAPVLSLQAHTQELELSAKDSTRRKHIAWLSMMVTNKTGLTNAMKLKIHGPRRTQVVLVLTRMRRLAVLSQVLVLNARVSLKKQGDPNTMVTHRLGLMIASQEEIHGLRLLVAPVLVVLTQELELSAKDSTRKHIAWLSMMVTHRLGSMTAIQQEIHWFKPMVALVL
jgi:hypothetical protein